MISAKDRVVDGWR